MGIEDALRKNKILVIICGLLLGLCVLVGVCIRAVGAETSNSNTDDDNGIAAYSVDETANTRKLMNGSFESEQTWSKSYNSVKQSAVPYWNTTATDEYIEMFMTNTSSYIPNVKLEPTDDSYAVELNANEESTLYQNVVTSPSSIYSWGLDHGARTSADTMALVIGPSQDNNPSKPSKTGRDQLMQMVDWLIDEGITEVGDSAGIKEQIVVYSKKFGENGTFLDNEGNDAFSLEPSSIYTEEWHIWIITDCKATSGTNPWGQYGANAAGTGEGGSSEMDLDEYYLYTVPSGQTKTMFGFVSVGCKDGKDKTYGNFLDNINFKLYYDLSGSITLHGSAVIVESSGGVEGEGGTGTETDHEITVGSKLTMYVEDGAPFKLQAIVKAEDARAGCEFVGMYFTKQDDEGNPETVFFGKELWTVSTNDNNDIVYTYNLENTSSAIDLQFVFIKSPTITYDPNDGEAYVVTREHNTSELDSVYSFKPEVGSEGTKTYIPACVSHEAVSEKEGWIFIGWLLTGDQTTIPDGTVQVNEDQLGTMLLDGVHTVACDYSVGSDGQYFKIWNGNVATTPIISSSSDSVEWKSDGTTDIVYANVHKGLTMVAQWRWKQAFIPQIYNGTGYVDSANGGNVEISSVTDSSDSYYDSSFNGKGGKAYYANTDEIIVATATVKDGFTFDGWYDSEGNLVSTKTTLSYTETKEGVNTYYARFSESVKQIYTRQIKDGTVWADTDDDSIATLSRYDYIDTVGKNISCTATVGSGYEFLGWYDEDGNPVDSSLLSADGKTIKYTTTGNAEYYARFQRTIVDGKVYQKYIRQIRNGTDWEISTDDNMATLEKYADDSSGIGTNVSVTATVVGDYRFEGWYDASGVKVSDDLTLSYAVVGDTTYYARFSGKITQTYIRRVKNGDDWYTADDSVGVLSRYSHTDFYGERVSVTATAKEGYKFEGWYDSTGTAVDTSLLSDDGKTLSYITTENATYYARFAKIELTQTFERQLKSGSSWTTAGDTVGTLSRYTFTDYYGERVSVTATAKEGYKFEGWYDSTGNAVDTSLLSDDGKTLSYITTVNATYYARFAKIVLEERFTEILTQKDNALDLMSIVTSEYVEGKSLTWESSNTDIVTVDSNGNVLAVRNGVCTVFARTADGSYTAEFTITVNIQEQESGSDNDTEESTEESTEEGTNADNDDNDEITTGDNSRVLLWFILSMVSVSFITALYAGRMKVNVKNK